MENELKAYKQQNKTLKSYIRHLEARIKTLEAVANQACENELDAIIRESCEAARVDASATDARKNAEVVLLEKWWGMTGGAK